ncbi:5 -3 exoribonuclease 1 [Paramuricea clavata]|uniref:5 -3 exoribonuclease 1 n=1 Tax=Paramuricea clavata TaxID=317549 RepID=A0A7D9ICS3_PARCT|nr:5 -3 exoribonuclease 1 [Paramuricea clavata]
MGQKQFKDFVQQRWTGPLQQQPNNEQGETKVQFTDTMHKNNAITFDSLYQVAEGGKKKEKNTMLRADRSVLQRLIVAYGAGREVDLHNVLSHQLMSVPISLAETNGKLRTGQKAALADVLTRGIECPSAIDLQGSGCLLIDGMTFGAYEDRFEDAVLVAGSRY